MLTSPSLELLVNGKVPKERVIIKKQEDEQRLRNLPNRIIIKQEEMKAPTAQNLEVFRNQLRIQVGGELDIDKKKNSS